MRPFNRKLLITLLFLTSCSGSNIQVEVDQNLMKSRGFPAVDIQVDETFEYLGSDRFDLYGVADAEIHLYGELDGDRIRRLIWIQFEGYQASRIFSWYDYSDSERRTRIGDYEYFDDTWPWRLEKAKARTGSDTEHVLELIAKRNLTLGPDVMAIRLVRLDESARNELMIIHIEDLADHNLTAPDLSEDGDAHGQWPELSGQLRQRALASFSLIENE